MFDILLTEDQRRFRDRVRHFVREVPSQLLRDMDAERIKYPREFVTGLGAAGLLGVRFPPGHGGLGLSWTEELAALEEVGVLGAALGCAYAMPSIVGEALSVFGSDEQRQRYLQPLLAGKLVAAEALTEPRGGSDFFGATTSARRDGDGFLLSGAKRFIVGAEGADLFLVYARTAADAPAHKSLSVLLVERSMGIEVQKVYGLMGTRGGGTGRIVFRDVRVPAANLVGGLHEGGRVFNRMMIPERLTSAGGALGAGRAALEVALRYSTKRKAFGKLLREFEGVTFKLAEAQTGLDAARALAYVAGRAASERPDEGTTRRLVSEAKKAATEASWTAINHAMQVLGGIGYTHVYPVERLLRDARLMLIWTGTNEIMNLLVQHELYRELGAPPVPGRDLEQDALDGDEQERVYE